MKRSKRLIKSRLRGLLVTRKVFDLVRSRAVQALVVLVLLSGLGVMFFDHGTPAKAASFLKEYSFNAAYHYTFGNAVSVYPDSFTPGTGAVARLKYFTHGDSLNFGPSPSEGTTLDDVKYKSVAALSSSRIVTVQTNRADGITIVGLFGASGTTVTELDTDTATIPQAYGVRVVAMDATHFLIAYVEDQGGITPGQARGVIRVGTITGDVLSFGTETELFSQVFTCAGGCTTSYLSHYDSEDFPLAAIDGDNFVLGDTVVGTVTYDVDPTLSSITLNAGVFIPSDPVTPGFEKRSEAIPLDATHYVYVEDGDAYLATITFDPNPLNHTITLGAATPYDGGYASFHGFHGVRIDANTFVLTYNACNGFDCLVSSTTWAVVASVDPGYTLITFGTPVQIGESPLGLTTPIDVAVLNASTLVFTYNDSLIFNTSRVHRAANLTGTTITLSPAEIGTDHTLYSWGAVTAVLDATRVAVFNGKEITSRGVGEVEVMELTGYSTDLPTIQPYSPLRVHNLLSWDNFSASETTPAGTLIRYQLSPDNGATWYYSLGGVWTVDATPDEGAAELQFNSAFEIDANIASFPVGTGSLLFRAFLGTISSSDTPELDSVSISYTTSDQPLMLWQEAGHINPLVNFVAGDTLYITSLDRSNAGAGTIDVIVSNVLRGDDETVTLTETGPSSGEFEGSVPSVLFTGANLVSSDGTIQGISGDYIRLTATFGSQQMIDDMESYSVGAAPGIWGGQLNSEGTPSVETEGANKFFRLTTDQATGEINRNLSTSFSFYTDAPSPLLNFYDRNIEFDVRVSDVGSLTGNGVSVSLYSTDTATFIPLSSSITHLVPTPTTGWTHYTLPLSSFTTQAGGGVLTGNDPDPSVIDAIAFQMEYTGTNPGDAYIDIDNLAIGGGTEYYETTPTTSAVVSNSTAYTHSSFVIIDDRAYFAVADSASAGAGTVNANTSVPASGDTELVTLTESPVFAGLFLGSLPVRDTSSGVTNENGRIEANAGDTLNISYNGGVATDSTIVVSSGTIEFIDNVGAPLTTVANGDTAYIRYISIPNAGAGSVNATATSTTGDSETVVLTEQGISTGIYVGSIPFDGPVVFVGDGTLQAADGATISASIAVDFEIDNFESYTDPAPPLLSGAWSDLLGGTTPVLVDGSSPEIPTDGPRSQPSDTKFMQGAITPAQVMGAAMGRGTAYSPAINFSAGDQLIFDVFVDDFNGLDPVGNNVGGGLPTNVKNFTLILLDSSFNLGIYEVPMSDLTENDWASVTVDPGSIVLDPDGDSTDLDLTDVSTVYYFFVTGDGATGRTLNFGLDTMTHQGNISDTATTSVTTAAPTIRITDSGFVDISTIASGQSMKVELTAPGLAGSGSASVDMTTSAGDALSVTVTETGFGTGIFQSGAVSYTSGAVSTLNGTLEGTGGGTVTASYGSLVYTIYDDFETWVDQGASNGWTAANNSAEQLLSTAVNRRYIPDDSVAGGGKFIESTVDGERSQYRRVETIALPSFQLGTYMVFPPFPGFPYMATRNVQFEYYLSNPSALVSAVAVDAWDGASWVSLSSLGLSGSTPDTWSLTAISCSGCGGATFTGLRFSFAIDDVNLNTLPNSDIVIGFDNFKTNNEFGQTTIQDFESYADTAALNVDWTVPTSYPMILSTTGQRHNIAAPGVNGGNTFMEYQMDPTLDPYGMYLDRPGLTHDLTARDIEFDLYVDNPANISTTGYSAADIGFPDPVTIANVQVVVSSGAGTSAVATIAPGTLGAGSWNHITLSQADFSAWMTSEALPNYAAITDLKIFIPNGDGPGGAAETALTVGIDNLETPLTAPATDSVTVSGAAPAPTGGSGPNPAAPSNPSSVAPVALSTTSIQWNFNDTSSGANAATGFEIVDGTGAVHVSTLPNAVSGITSLTETGLTANTRYTDRYVHSLNANGFSGLTSLPGVYTFIEAPARMVIDATTGDTMTLHALPAAPQIAFTNLGDGQSALYFENVTLGTNSGWITSPTWTTTGLTVGTTYDIRVMARNGDGVVTTWYQTSLVASSVPTPAIQLTLGVGINVADQQVHGASVANTLFGKMNFQSRRLFVDAARGLSDLLTVLFIGLMLFLFSAAVNLVQCLKRNDWRLARKLLVVLPMLRTNAADSFQKYSCRNENGTFACSFDQHRRLHTLSRKLLGGAGVLALAKAFLVVMLLVLSIPTSGMASRDPYNDGGKPVVAGDTLTYIAEFSNSGIAAADNAIVTDTIPSQLTMVPGSVAVVIDGVQQSAVTSLSGNDLNISIGTLGSGSSGYALFSTTVGNSPSFVGQDITNHVGMSTSNFVTASSNSIINPIVAVLPPACTPSAEVCDGIDNDCDGAIDNGVLTAYYADSDGDTYGAGAATYACAAPAGLVTTSTDCDDTNSAIHPSAIDIVGNSIDEDCSGADAVAAFSGIVIDSVSTTEFIPLNSSAGTAPSLTNTPDTDEVTNGITAPETQSPVTSHQSSGTTTLTIRGRAQPDTDHIDLLINSTPITVTISSPSLPNWSYTTTQTMDEGGHTVTATALSNTNAVLATSAPYPFTLAFAIPPILPSVIPPTVVPPAVVPPVAATTPSLASTVTSLLSTSVIPAPLASLLNALLPASIRNIINNPALENAVQNLITPALAAIGLAATIPAIGFTMLNLLPYLHLLFLEPLIGIFKQKRPPWGIVYNALGKQPVDLAIVRLYDAVTKKLIQTKITDAQGRYIMIVKEPGRYYLSVIKNNFTFPTAYLKDDKADAGYTDLYHGEVIEVKEGGIVLTANIPLDPVDQKVTTEKEALWIHFKQKTRTTVSASGMILAGVAWVINPTVLVSAFLVLHIVLYLAFRRIAAQRAPKSWGIIYDETTKAPLKNAVVRIFDTRFNKLLETQVTDSKGRYSFLVGKNVYQLVSIKSGYADEKLEQVDTTRTEEIVKVDLGMEKK